MSPPLPSESGCRDAVDRLRTIGSLWRRRHGRRPTTASSDPAEAPEHGARPVEQHAQLRQSRPRLKTDEVGDVLQVARVRILRYLARRGVVHLSPEALEINDELAARDPVLAQPAAAAVSGLPPAGPELRCCLTFTRRLYAWDGVCARRAERQRWYSSS